MNYQDTQDGKTGSFKCTEVDGFIRTYMGLEKDAGKLPKGGSLATGSMAISIDTGDVRIYEQTTETWILQ